MGLSLEAVLDSVKEWQAGGTGSGEISAAPATADERSEAAIVAQNEAALRQLQTMMPGLGV